MIRSFKETFIKVGAISSMQIAFTQCAKTPAEEIKERAPINSGLSKLKRIQNYVFKLAQKNYQLGENQRQKFGDPLSALSISLTEKQILLQLREIGILDSSGLASQLTLFVGSGKGMIEGQIRRNFPGLDCFALEPLDQYAHYAIEQSNFPSNRQLIMSLQELPERYKFDVIFVLNYNVASSQEEFFDKLYHSLKPGGKVIIARANTDPEHINSNKTIGAYLKARFNEVTYPGWEEPGKKPDYNYNLSFYKAIKRLDIDPGINPPPPTELETYINTFNKQQWQKRVQKNTLALKEEIWTITINQITLWELERVSGLAGSMSPERFFSAPARPQPKQGPDQLPMVPQLGTP